MKVSVFFTVIIVFCYNPNHAFGQSDPDDANVVVPTVTIAEATDENEPYQRKIIIKIPEPLLCFPHFNDTLLTLQNGTVLDDLYNLKLVRPSDLFPVVATLSIPLFISLKIIQLLVRYSDTTFLPNYQDKLVNAKIDHAISRTEIVHLKAKLETIANRLQTVTSDNFPEDVKKMELSVALDKCEEILYVFQNRDHVFYNNPAASLPFIVLFSGPYKILLEAGSVLIPSKAEVYDQQLNSLRAVIDDYKAVTVTKRMEGLLYDKKNVYPSVKSFVTTAWKNKVVPYDIEISLTDPEGGWGPCHQVQQVETFNSTYAEELQFHFMDQYKANLTRKYRQFFDSPKEVFKLQDCDVNCGKNGATLSATTSVHSLLNFIPQFLFCLFIPFIVSRL